MWNLLPALKGIDNETWGEYAFSRELLRDRIPESKKIEMIQKSIRCGEEYADRIQKETGKKEPWNIAEQLGLKVDDSDLPAGVKRVLFAQFTPPNQIEIMREPLEKYKAVLAGLQGEQAKRLPAEEEIRGILLGHEIFHFLEERDSLSIYTRTERIRLWHFWRFQNCSTVGALGEIAGMAFTEKLNCLSYSPFLLDVLLFFGYNPDGAGSICRDIQQILDRRNPKTRNW